MCEWLSCVWVILFLTLHSSLLPHGHSSGCVGLFHHLLMAVVQVKHLGVGEGEGGGGGRLR